MKICPFCLKKYKKLTEEHVFPNSWYPENLPPNTEKWKVPSCKSCNETFGKIEQDVLIFTGLSSDPNNDLSQPALRKAMQSLDPSRGRDKRDKAARLKKLKDVVREARPVFGTNLKPFPNFGFHKGFDPRVQMGISVPEGLDKIGKKLIRGIEYKLSNRMLDNDYAVESYFCYTESITDVINLIRSKGQKTTVVQGIEFYRASTPNDESVLYEIKIWDKLIIYGSIMKKIV